MFGAVCLLPPFLSQIQHSICIEIKIDQSGFRLVKCWDGAGFPTLSFQGGRRGEPGLYLLFNITIHLIAPEIAHWLCYVCFFLPSG